MTGKLMPPDTPQQVGRTKARVHDLERRLARPQTKPTPYIAKFSLPGTIYVSESGCDGHPTGGRLVLVYAKLVTAGTTATVLDLTRNTVAFRQLTLPATIRYNEVVVDVGFAAKTDDFQVEVVTAGAGARSLTVFGIFDR